MSQKDLDEREEILQAASDNAETAEAAEAAEPEAEPSELQKVLAELAALQDEVAELKKRPARGKGSTPPKQPTAIPTVEPNNALNQWERENLYLKQREQWLRSLK